jgi:periplasmic divalent cation tolerance protein
MSLNKSTDLLIVVTSFASLEDAKKMARQLIENQLAACVQIQEGMHSVYRWEGKIYEESEILLSIKTISKKWMDVCNLIKAQHPYRLPEVIAYLPEKYEEQYGKWVQAEVK